MLKRRRQNFIDFEVQTHLVYRLCLHWAAFLCTTAVAIFFWIRVTEGPAQDWDTAWSRFMNTMTPMLLVSLVLLPPFILDAVKLSNRFAGPISRLRVTLSKLAAGETAKPLEFRSNDFWKKLADDFNQVTAFHGSSARDEGVSS
jgi:methyl-accepting chemotaxis protein